MRVLLVCYEKEPKVVSIPHELSELQKLVGGMIEVVEPSDDSIALVCDENARCSGKPINRVINDRVDICGDFFLCGYGETGLEDMPEEKIFKYASLLHLSNNDNDPHEPKVTKSWHQISHR